MLGSEVLSVAEILMKNCMGHFPRTPGIYLHISTCNKIRQLLAIQQQRSKLQSHDIDIRWTK